MRTVPAARGAVLLRETANGDMPLGSSANYFEWTNIPQDDRFEHLQIEIGLTRLSRALVEDWVCIRINGDGSAIYDSHLMRMAVASGTASGGDVGTLTKQLEAAQNRGFLFMAPAANAGNVDNAAAGTIHIPHYKTAAHKLWIGNAIGQADSGSFTTITAGGCYRAGAAITSIRIFGNDSGGANLIGAGSSASLYLLP